MSKEPTNQELQKREPAAVEYVPYGAQDKIKMTVGIIQTYIAVKTKSGKTCSERDAVKFMGMCQAKRMNPMEGDCYLIGYDGKDGPTFSLVTAHQTYLKRAELHPEFDGMDSGVIVLTDDGQLSDLPGDFYAEGQQVVGGWATVHFKTRKHPMVKRLRLSTFNKGYGQWNDNPNGMIVKCAEADALRSAFPTMLGGLYMREEVNIETQFAKPDFATSGKPLFGQNVELPPVETTPTPQLPAESADDGLGPVTPPEPEHPEDGPPPSEPEKPAPKGGFNPLKALRGLLTMSKLKEGEYLDWLASTGATDGSIESLEQLAMEKGPDWMKAQTEEWPRISAAILEIKKKGGAK